MNKKIKGIYLIEFNNGIKVGHSNNCLERIRTYLSPWCREIINAYYLECHYPKLVEKQVLNRYKRNIKTEYSTEFITDVSLKELMDYGYSKRNVSHKGMWQNSHWYSDVVWSVFKK